MLGLSILLILVTIIDGFKVADSWMFIALEVIINMLITADFACRVKMAGCKKFFKASGEHRWWNYFDAFVVVTCLLLFLVAISARKGTFKNVDESLEQIVLVLWCIWQIFRLLLIAKKQRLAKQNAMTLINFENIVVDTEFGQQTDRSIKLEDQDDVGFHAMTNDSDISKSGRIRGRRSSLTGSKSVEMKELNKGKSSVQSAGMKLAFEGIARQQEIEIDSKPNEIP